ncbi:Autotransporter domain-containing protein [Fusobacterium necrophorum subsp. funduliforme]
MILVTKFGKKKEERRNRKGIFYSQVTSRNWSDLQSRKYLNAELHKERIMRRISEVIAKNLSSKPVSEATWKNLVNTSSVITGPGADVIANRIPVGEREYYSTEIFTSETYSFGGRVSRTQSAFTLVNDKSKTLTTYNIGSTSVGFGLLDIGGSVGVGLYLDDTVEDLSKLTTSIGVSKVFGIVSLGTDLLFKKGSKIPRGIRFYIGKGLPSPVPIEVHTTVIEIGSPKNIKSDKRAYNVFDKFTKESRQRGGEW